MDWIHNPCKNIIKGFIKIFCALQIYLSTEFSFFFKSTCSINMEIFVAGGVVFLFEGFKIKKKLKFQEKCEVNLPLSFLFASWFIRFIEIGKPRGLIMD